MPKRRRIGWSEFIFVKGRGAFPIDMLRYDSCVPATESDSYRIAGPEDEERRIRLRTFSENVRDNGPTLGRWQSFGWEGCTEAGIPLSALTARGR